MRRRPVRTRLAVAAAVLGLVLGSVGTGAATAATEATFEARGSAKQVYVTAAAAGTTLTLLSPAGAAVATTKVNSLGGALFREVAPGAGYTVRAADGALSAPLQVHPEDSAPWNPEVYDQYIPDHGYGYLTTRDGTKLSLYVHPPTSPAGLGVPEGDVPAAGVDYTPPYPTLIEYSGYGYANPAGPNSGIAVIANTMGFAVVDVNMRGTGCSGGAFDFFEPLQSLDGYDVVETIAKQPWVKGNKVGMMGISYGGISQLFTAAQQPPSLAAISPMSVIDATATTLYPGGILNTGFAVAWAQERQHEAKVAGPNSGQRWAHEKIQAGDTVCAANQTLHPEANDLMAKIAANKHYIPATADPLDPVTFVHKITVPTFMSCQWQDEQTGGHCPTLAAKMTGTSKKWFTFTNGPHIDSLAPETYNRWYDFLMLYVAEQAPARHAAVVQAGAPVVFNAAMGIPQDDPILLPPDPIQAIPEYGLAKAMFEALPSIRILFDNGAGMGPAGRNKPGDPYPGYEKSFASWPIPSTQARTWYLGAGGSLTDGLPAAGGVDRYTSDATAVRRTSYTGGTGGGGLWGNASQWKYDWQQNPAGTSLSYLTPPLATTTTVVGAGALYLWASSSTPDVDLLATVSEVSAAGKETFVQNGFLRASQRKLSHDSNNEMHTPSTLLEPVPTFTEADAAPMPSETLVPVAVPLYYSGHSYRAGTRIKVTLSAPNGTQPIWSFNSAEPVGTTSDVQVGYSATMPSKLVLPVIPDVAVPTGQPICPSLRNEPCRTFVPSTNLAGDLALLESVPTPVVPEAPLAVLLPIVALTGIGALVLRRRRA